jgi:hypothetical protein
MKTFKDKITLNKNSRGCYILDTVKGCSCLNKKEKGCYDDCYANNIASRYGFDFSKIAKRNFYREETEQLYFLDFYDSKHEDKIIEQIKNIKMPFVRIGEMGDPSEDWQHTINICKLIYKSEKPIVIITKHWNILTDEQLEEIKDLNIIINTSISALDNDDEIETRLNQYNRIKKYCNSILRIVSCDFNLENNEGKLRSIIQRELFKNDKIIDTVFRPNKNNQLVKNKIINVEKVKFLKSEMLASVYNKNTYFGECKKCPEMCGVNLC